MKSADELQREMAEIVRRHDGDIVFCLQRLAELNRVESALMRVLTAAEEWAPALRRTRSEWRLDGGPTHYIDELLEAIAEARRLIPKEKSDG